MVTVLATTVVRNGFEGHNGYLFEIDWDLKRIVHQLEIHNPLIDDLGPRGGARGARGVVSGNGHYYVANFNTIFVFDSSWQLVREISHPLFNGIHEIECDIDGLWVSSTGLDAVLKVDWHGQLLESIFLGELGQSWRDLLHIQSRQIDKHADHREIIYSTANHVTHVNSVKLHDNKPYLCLYNQGAVISLDPLNIVVPPSDISGFHNGMRVSDDLILANSSFEKKLYGFDPGTGEKCLEVNWLTDLQAASDRTAHYMTEIFDHQNMGNSTAVAGWTRGLAMLPGGCVLIGLAPATIIEFDPDTKTVVDHFIIYDDVQHAIHGLSILQT